MDLTEEEIALAQKLNFDLEVLDLIKASLKVPLQEFEGARSLEFYRDVRGVGYWTPEVKQHQIAILKTVAERSPDAAALISEWIDKLAGPLTDAEQKFFEGEAKDHEFQQRSAAYADYIAAEWSRASHEATSGFFIIPSFLKDCGDGTSVEERLEQMKRYFADKPRPQAPPQPPPQPSLPETGVVLRVSTLFWGPKRRSLRSALKKTPYELLELSNYRETKTFWSKQEADDYAAGLGRVGSTGGSRTINPRSYKIGEEDNSRRLFEGDETITKVGPNEYEVLPQTRFVVNFPVSIILLSKV